MRQFCIILVLLSPFVYCGKKCEPNEFNRRLMLLAQERNMDWVPCCECKKEAVRLASKPLVGRIPDYVTYFPRYGTTKEDIVLRLYQKSDSGVVYVFCAHGPKRIICVEEPKVYNV